MGEGSRSARRSSRPSARPAAWRSGGSHYLGISQNYVPAIEAGARRAGPKLQEQMVRYFGGPFESIFDVVLVDP